MKNTNAKTNRLKDFLNHVSGWVAAVIFISIGIVFIVRADLVSSVIIYAAAAICAALGVVSLISYFRKRPAMHSGNPALVSLLFAVLYFYSPITEKGRGLILLFEGICSLVLLIMRKSIDKTAEVERGEAPKTKAAKMEKAEEAKDEEPKIEKAEEAKAEEPKADE